MDSKEEGVVTCALLMRIMGHGVEPRLRYSLCPYYVVKNTSSHLSASHRNALLASRSHYYLVLFIANGCRTLKRGSSTRCEPIFCIAYLPTTHEVIARKAVVSGRWLLALHTTLPDAQLCSLEPLDFHAMDMIARLATESAEGGGLRHLWQF